MKSQKMRNINFHAKQQLNLQINALRDVFLSIIAEEMITENGLDRLKSFYKENPIPADLLPVVRDEAFCQAAHFEIIDQGSSNRETFWLLHLAIGLGISPNMMSWMEEEVCTLAILKHIQDGSVDDIPTVKAESIILGSDEKAFAELPAMLVPSHPLNEDIANGLPGKSFRLARGSRYKIGDKKSDLLDKTDISNSDAGFLVLTNKRMIYSGTHESVSADIAGLFGTRIFADSVQFATIREERVITVGFQNPLAAEYCGVVLSKLMNQ
ncbi:MAG: hypothetical protein R2681_17035 [Pyrinomonadaceae bacterium]